jgi:NAD+ synthase
MVDTARGASPPASSAALSIDAAAEADRIAAWLRTAVRSLRRRGVVLGISGGIDSSVCLALCVEAFGAGQVVPLLLPERDSDPASERLARYLAAQLGVTPILNDITSALEGMGCYARRDEAIARVFPAYDPRAGYKARITLPQDLLEHGTLNVYSLTVVAPDGRETTARLPPAEFAQIVAATNFKQRTRAAALYFHAELRHFAVIGSPNKSEHDLGFFVKHADNGVDLMPLAHLYKTQVYQLARHLGVPEAILERTPTSDTYSAPVSQKEFFFRLPFELLDPLLDAQLGGRQPADVAETLDLTSAQVGNAWDDFTRKQRSARYLRSRALDMSAMGRPVAARD